MKRLSLGVVLATLAVYAWGMLYWGFNPLPYAAWQRTNDDVAAGQALLEHFPRSGTYFIPGMYNDDETLTRLYESGPVAFVHMISRDGRPRVDPAIFVKGLALDFVVVSLVALLLWQAGLPTYRARLTVVVLAGAAAAVLIDVGATVWWYIDWEWKLAQALYDWSAFVVAGLVLAGFVRPERAGAGV